MRTFRLGAEYDKEALQDRLLENQRDIRVTRRYFEFMRPYTREYARKNPPPEEYYRQRDFYLHLPRVTGYLSFFRCVAIVLGVAPLYEKEYRQPLSAECREACRKLDRFTAEITLIPASSICITSCHRFGLPLPSMLVCASSSTMTISGWRLMMACVSISSSSFPL